MIGCTGLACQLNRAVLNFHANLLCGYGALPFEFSHHGLLKLDISFQVAPLNGLRKANVAPIYRHHMCATGHSLP